MKGHRKHNWTERKRYLPPHSFQRPHYFVASIIVGSLLLLGYFILHWRVLQSSTEQDTLIMFQAPVLHSPTMTTAAAAAAAAAPLLVVVAPTFYTGLNETRYRLGVQACREAAKHHICLILVDASPTDDIREGLEAAGRGDLQDIHDPMNKNRKGYVKVVRQTALGKKGAALREAIQLAYQEATMHQQMTTQGGPHHPDASNVGSSSSNAVAVIGFQELEKVDMMRHWLPLVQHMMDTSADVTVPRREDAIFRSQYPIEQYHCESFANLFLNSLGAEIGLTASIDWTMGPLAFRLTEAHHWMDFTEGELWDAQLVPLVKAHLAGAKVTSFQVDYYHPQSMKDEEEGVAKWNEKRLMQLNFLKDTVGKLMIENAVSAKSNS